MIPFIILFIVSYLLLNQLNHDALNNFKTKSNISTIILGGSQIQMSINDQLIPHSTNLSLDAESYQFSYFKLKGILKNNPTIKNLYLGCGYFYFSTFYDEYIFGKHSEDFFSRYFFILPTKEKKHILLNNIPNFSSSIRKTFSYGFNNINKSQDQLSFIGYYKNTFSNTAANQTSIQNRLNVQFYENGRERSFSSNNEIYLKKIVLLCKKEKIKLVLFSPPLHPTYKKKIPRKFIQKFDYEMKKNKLKVIDFSSIQLADSCYLPDGSHVTAYGAKLTTQLFKQKTQTIK